MTQKAVILHPGARKLTEVAIPIVPAHPGELHPRDYQTLLPKADPEHLLLADCPFSHLTKRRVVVVYDASHRGAANDTASRLTANVEDGLDVGVNGDALVFFAEPGCDFGEGQWAELDNVIYDELLEFFGQGLKPKAEDLQRLAKAYDAGEYRYAAEADANYDDLNKDDGGLPGWG